VEVGRGRSRVGDVQLVVGAVIVDSLADPRRVLATRRSRPEALKGRWEFSGWQG